MFEIDLKDFERGRRDYVNLPFSIGLLLKETGVFDMRKVT